MVSKDHFNMHRNDCHQPNDFSQLSPSAHFHDELICLVFTTTLDNHLLSSPHDNLNNSPHGDSEGGYLDGVGNVPYGQVSLLSVFFLVLIMSCQGPSSSCAEEPNIFPSNSMEALLLLESAHANHQLWLTHQSLALQSIHQNMLKLQYNWLVLERAQKGLCNADKAIGHIWFLICQSGIPYL
jgi:hypothetical protein